MADHDVGILGASSLLGSCLLPLLTLTGARVTAFTRQPDGKSDKGVTWRQLPSVGQNSLQPFSPKVEGEIRYWICVAPIWVLTEHLALLETYAAKRLVVLSSTSRFTKNHSSDSEEQDTAHLLSDAEARVQTWAENHGVEWIILRPTLIYGLGRDKNISEIARFIRRFGFFPLLGEAKGLRQPIHTSDVADACMAALRTPGAKNRAYNLSGGETLAYRDMIVRVFTALGRRPRLLPVPLSVFRLAVSLLRHLPRYRQWSTAMAERMNRDLVFDHSEATIDLGFMPKRFELTKMDLPS